MAESDSQLPIIRDSIIDSLSDFERDELRFKLSATEFQDYCLRVKDWRNLMPLALHLTLFCGGFFGIFMGAFAGCVAGLKSGFLAGLGLFLTTAFSAGLIFGLCMAVGMICLIRFFIPRLMKKLSQRKSMMFTVNEFEISLPSAEAFEVCLSSLSGQRGVRVETTNREQGAMSALTSLSWKSPGEIIGVKLDTIATDRSRVRVYSKYLLSGLDFGKNEQNVRTLSKCINEAVHVHSILKLP
jgi:hypothetical protein